MPDSEPERLEYHRLRRERKKARKGKLNGTEVIDITGGSGSGSDEVLILEDRSTSVIVIDDDDDDEVEIVQGPSLASRYAYKAESSNKSKRSAASPLALLPPPAEPKEPIKPPTWLKTTRVLQQLTACPVCNRAWKGAKEKTGIGKWVRGIGGGWHTSLTL